MSLFNALIYDDTYINSQATSTNYSTGEDWFMGEQWGGSGSFRRVTLMRVDLRPYLEDVTSAVLNFYQYSGSYGASKNLAARRCLKSYVARQITWSDYATGSSWDRDVADDDFSSTTYGDFSPTDSTGWKQMTLTTLVNSFRGQVLAFGIAFTVATGSQNSLAARSPRYLADTTLRPYLAIDTPQSNYVLQGSASPMVMG